MTDEAGPCCKVLRTVPKPVNIIVLCSSTDDDVVAADGDHDDDIANDCSGTDSEGAGYEVRRQSQKLNTQICVATADIHIRFVPR